MAFAKKEWQEALSEFSDVVLTKAILNCREFYEFPPTLPQLIQCCRQIHKHLVCEVEGKTYIRANEEIVASCLQECKKILRGEKC